MGYFIYIIFTDFDFSSVSFYSSELAEKQRYVRLIPGAYKITSEFKS